MKPEKKPPVVAGAHGLLKSLMTTLWLMGWKWNSRTSPTLALMVSGLKARAPLSPTSTRVVVEAPAASVP